VKVSINQDRCIGSGQCVMIACEVFDQNEEGLVVLLDEDPPETVRNRVRQAAQNCPTRVISLTE